MDDEVNHYIVLGLPSGEEGAKLSEKEITKAYRKKALELHPDKRRDNRNAHFDIQQLNSSYTILKDERARKSFDDLLRFKHEKIHCQAHRDSKRQAQWGLGRQKLMSDLEERERVALASDSATKVREEEERICMKFKEEVARIRATNANKVGSGLDKEKVLKVSWERIGENYNAESLRELFEKFGEVEDVVIKSSKKRGNALLVMATKDAVVAAARNVYGNLSNPLRVLPLQLSIATFPSTQRSVEPDGPKLSNHFGAGFEDSVLKKVQKVIAGSSIADGRKALRPVNQMEPLCATPKLTPGGGGTGSSSHPSCMLGESSGGVCEPAQPEHRNMASHACHGDDLSAAWFSH